MCDAISADRIQSKVDEFVSLSKVFTAFDITTALRQEFSDFTERHRGVRRMIHRMFIPGYERTAAQLSINGTPTDVLVYHPEGVDASTHPMAIASTAQTVADATAGVAPAASVTSSASPDAAAIPLTKENRLQIPKQFTDKVQGDSVTVTFGGKLISCTKNKDGRVRISAANLDHRVPSVYSVSFDPATNAVVIA